MTTTRHAYTAVIIKGGGGFGIGRADVGTKGYTPIYEEGPFDTYTAARERAKEMNTRLGLTVEEAWEIVASTMAGKGTRR